MKKMILGMMFAIGLTSSVSFANRPSASELSHGFVMCTNNDSSWTQRWGNYVVAFDIYAASATCRKTSTEPMMEPAMTGCHIDGHWVNAGYYCKEINTGG